MIRFVITNLEIVKSKVHTLSCLSIASFTFSTSAFLYLTNRMKNSYGEIDELTQAEKICHTLKFLCEWPSAREQLRLENMYDPKLRTHLGDKLWTNQKFNASKVSENTNATTEDILEKILEREGTLDIFSTKFLLIPNLFFQQFGRNWKRTATFSSKLWHFKRVSIPNTTSETRNI